MARGSQQSLRYYSAIGAAIGVTCQLLSPVRPRDSICEASRGRRWGQVAGCVEHVGDAQVAQHVVRGSRDRPTEPRALRVCNVDDKTHVKPAEGAGGGKSLVALSTWVMPRWRSTWCEAAGTAPLSHRWGSSCVGAAVAAASCKHRRRCSICSSRTCSHEVSQSVSIYQHIWMLSTAPLSHRWGSSCVGAAVAAASCRHLRRCSMCSSRTCSTSQ